MRRPTAAAGTAPRGSRSGGRHGSEDLGHGVGVGWVQGVVGPFADLLAGDQVRGDEFLHVVGHRRCGDAQRLCEGVGTDSAVRVGGDQVEDRQAGRVRQRFEEHAGFLGMVEDIAGQVFRWGHRVCRLPVAADGGQGYSGGHGSNIDGG